jgi:hypothetical protein
MARKEKPHEEELPFVALMDTMTNVVGVLIIVLVMIGISLARTVQKVLSDLPMVTEQEHQQLKSEMTQFDDKRDPIEVEADIAKLKEDLEKVLARIRQMQEQDQKIPPLPEDLQKMLKELEALRKERDQRKITVQDLLAQIDKYKVQLDTSPKPKALPSITARLPNPRPMPENAQMHEVLVVENKMFLLRREEVRNMVVEELKKAPINILARTPSARGASRSLLSAPQPTPQKNANAPKQLVFDPQKITQFFHEKLNLRIASSARVANHDVLVQVEQQPNSPNIALHIFPRPDGGETVDQARQDTTRSRFAHYVHALKSDPRAVLKFLVNSKAVHAYLEARNIVDAEGVPVTWEINDTLKFSSTLPPDYLVQFTPPPAPATPPATPPPSPPKPAGPPPVVIAAPKASVD